MKPTAADIRLECDLWRARRLRDLSRAQAEETEAVIDALTGHIDPTAPEFGSLSVGEQLAAQRALEWQEGIGRVRPSARLLQ